MRYAYASWNFEEESEPLWRQVEWFHEHGFDAVSLDPMRQAALLDPQQARSVGAVTAERGMAVTLHGSTPIGLSSVGLMTEIFGERLLNITMNPVMWHDSRGMLIDARTLATRLTEIRAATEGSDIRFGIEDFPRDRLALESFRADLAPLLPCPRFGALMDLGHMNLWLRTRPYYTGITVPKYLAAVPVPIVEVHVHDNDGRQDHHEALGCGTLDTAAAARGLRAAGFDRVSTIEVNPRAHGKTVAEAKPAAVRSLALWKAAWQHGA